MSNEVKIISSMATSGLLEALCPMVSQAIDHTVAAESIGGVDATRRIKSGEVFDVVVLADRAIDQLISEGHVRDGTRTDLARSKVAIAVAKAASVPDISSEASLKEALTGAATVGYSTGPSGVAIVQIIERWGLTDQLKDKLVQARPGQPVGTLIAQGEVEIGFQQMSELMHLPGIQIIGTMPPGTEIETVFSAAICTTSSQPEYAQKVLDYFVSEHAAQAKRNQGMNPL